MEKNAIQTARLYFNDEGTPVSRDFDDVYFSNDNGLAETRYTFIDGNKIPERFIRHNRPLFVVAESGFGTGLNFLTLWQTFEAFCDACPQSALKRLHFISFEKFPLHPDDLRQAHDRWPELASHAQALQAQWPHPFSGCHRLLLGGGRITLDLWFGDINQLTETLDDTLNGKVDAWFLDGFAPAKNADMWTQGLFQAMARLSRPDGTLATFTAAGFVRRGLQEAGFAMQKRKGFGHKRNMLTGERVPDREAPPRAPWYARRPAEGEMDAAIIGGGIASAMLALALLRRGWRVALYCEDEAPAQAASGNRQGALYPLINIHDPALATFFPAAFTYARRFYDALPVAFDHDWCGVTQLGWNEQSLHKTQQMLLSGLPEAIVHGLNRDAVEAYCGVNTGCAGVTWPQGGWLCPAELTTAALAHAIGQGLTVHYRHHLVSITPRDAQWQLHFSDSTRQQHSVIVLANGHQINRFEQTRHLPVYAVAGQVSHIPTTPGLSALRQVLCYDGYLTPVNPHNQHHCIGASYHRGQEIPAYSEDDQQHNRQRLLNCLPAADWTSEVDVSAGEARCGVRCATRDHLPMVGGVPDYEATLAQYAGLAGEANTPEQVALAPVYSNLFLLGALGSRGLCSAPLAAEILASQICDEPLPLDAQTLAALNPNRLWIRKLLKGKAVKSV